MAATKTPAKKPAKASKPKTAAKKPSGGNGKTNYEQRMRSKRQASAIILFTVGILLAAIALISGDNVWNWCHNFLFGLFGATVWVIPVALIYIAVMTTLDKPIGEIRHKLWQTGVLELLICGLAEVCSTDPFWGRDFFDTGVELFAKGKMLQGGGLFSGILGWPLYAACGKTGAVIIISLFLFAFVMLLTGSTLIGLFKGMAKPVQKMNETYVQRREEKEELEEQKRQAKFNIDVDLGPDEEQMPQHPVSSPKPTLEELMELEKQQTKSAAESKPKPAVLPEKQEIPVKAPEPVKPAEESAGTPPAAIETEPPPVVKEKEVDPMVDELVNRALNFTKAEKEGPSSKIDPVFDKNDQAKLYTDSVRGITQYVTPPISLLKAPKGGENHDVSGELHANADLLVNTLKSFGVQTKVIDISRGPTVTRYELQPSAGVKISKITGLADDIALNLAAAGVRIEAPIPNKAAVGIEVPNKKTDIVTIREIIDSKEFERAQSKLSFALGRDITGTPVVADISRMPHMLIAGATGSGKSVCINSIIISLLYKSAPSEVRFLMIDPKVVELGVYNGIPHLLVPVVTDPRKAAGALGWAVTEMLNRYKLFADNNVRDFFGYNALAEENQELNLNPLPQIVIIIDELADLMMAAPNEVEDSICRLAQMARAAGMHLVIATQRPSVDVITGIIKANIPSRIAFAVSSQVDSRTILDASGADKLLGRGDMLFAPLGIPKPVRVQGCFVSDKEVEQVIDFVKNRETAEYDNKILEEIEKQAVSEKSSSDSGGGFEDEDELLSEAIECVIDAGQASTSYLQRKLKVGYARAARLIDEMEDKGIIGGFEGSKPRQVLISRQQWIEMTMNQPQ